MSQASHPTPVVPSRNTYPLSALFLLVAVAGVLSSFVGPAARAVAAGHLGVSALLGSVFGGGLGFAIVGAVIGLYHHQRLRGFLMGTAVGLMVGSLIGPLTLATKDDAFGVAMLAAMSIVLLLATGAVMRYRQISRKR